MNDNETIKITWDKSSYSRVFSKKKIMEELATHDNDLTIFSMTVEYMGAKYSIARGVTWSSAYEKILTFVTNIDRKLKLEAL